MSQQKKNQPENKKQSGRWSKEQHERFMYGILHFGKNWKKVEEVVQTRNGSQVRSHAQKFFNKLHKSQKDQFEGKRKRSFEVNDKEDISESQRQFGFHFGDQASNTTPIELVSFIKNQSKEGNKINLDSFQQKLQMKIIEQQAQQCEPEQIGGLERRNSFKSMNNILSAYTTVKEEQKPINQIEQDQSFLILLTKKYKKLFTKIGEFSKLIDFGKEKKNASTSLRKKSFTLPEGVEGDEDDLLQRKKRVIELSYSAKMEEKQKDAYKEAVEKTVEKAKPSLE